jgi:hypothetical protein
MLVVIVHLRAITAALALVLFHLMVVVVAAARGALALIL